MKTSQPLPSQLVLRGSTHMRLLVLTFAAIFGLGTSSANSVQAQTNRSALAANIEQWGDPATITARAGYRANDAAV